MKSVLIRGFTIWVALVGIAVLNGIVREKLLVPTVGHLLALSASGLAFSILVFLTTLLLVPFIGKHKISKYCLVGFSWFFLTLAFEFLFGYFVLRKPLGEILEVFCFWKGNLFVVVLAFLIISPPLCAKIRGLVTG